MTIHVLLVLSDQIMPAIDDYALFGKPGKPVRKIIPSPNGEYLILVYGEGRTTHSPKTVGATLFRRKGASYLELGDLPLPSPQAFVLNDGSFLSLQADYYKVTLSRGRVNSDDTLTEEQRSDAITGGGLSEPWLVLLPSGNEILLGATNRDDGHGWSEPVYTTQWLRLNPRSGEILETSEVPMELKHLLPAPASPCVSLENGGNLESMRKIIEALPFRREFELRVGLRRLLTTSRVIDVASGETLLGECTSAFVRPRTFCDLSKDENYAIATGGNGGFELWTVEEKSVEELPLYALQGIRCGVFLSSGEIVIGSARGEAAIVTSGS